MTAYGAALRLYHYIRCIRRPASGASARYNPAVRRGAGDAEGDHLSVDPAQNPEASRPRKTAGSCRAAPAAGAAAQEQAAKQGLAHAEQG